MCCVMCDEKCVQFKSSKGTKTITLTFKYSKYNFSG